MDFVSLAVFSVAVVGLGAAATVMLAKWLPKSALERAAEHGRFVGLGSAKPVTQAEFRPKVRKEAMNVVRTSN
ncbi:MAG TPA: hypothetical protein VL689_17230 [Paraburkholderia sp.]|jgi:hypothetical protein|nr:hypothetical protein [Paraburkholderia sp.]